MVKIRMAPVYDFETPNNFMVCGHGFELKVFEFPGEGLAMCKWCEMYHDVEQMETGDIFIEGSPKIWD